MVLKDIYAFLNECLDEMESDDVYSAAEIMYYKNNISKIKKALNDGVLDSETITEEMLADYLNNGVDIPKKTISSSDVLKSTLSDTTIAKIAEVKKVESKQKSTPEEKVKI